MSIVSEYMITSSLEHVRQCMAQAAERAHRPLDEITLIAVSKQKPITAIETAWSQGVRCFAENRPHELAEKARSLSRLDGIKWHFIGHLQSRGSKLVAQYADCFHAVDRLRIARRLSNQLVELGRELDVFVQVNISGEASKSGFDCANWQHDQAQFHTLLAAIKEISSLPKLHMRGLMTMAPYGATTAQYRALFASTAQLSAALHAALPGLHAHGLSMGMSNDFDIAIEQGATHVRIGSAIFGTRQDAEAGKR